MAEGTYAKGLAAALDGAIAELERAAGERTGEQANRQRARGAPAAEGYGAARDEEKAPSPVTSSVPPETEAQPAPYAPPPAPAQAPAPGAPYAPPASAPVAAPPPPEVIASNLSMQIGRLETLHSWMRDDPAFSRLVDSLIGRQVQAAERRQRIFSSVLSVGSLVVGWLLSAFSPIGWQHPLGR